MHMIICENSNKNYNNCMLFQVGQKEKVLLSSCRGRQGDPRDHFRSSDISTLSFQIASQKDLSQEGGLVNWTKVPWL